MKNIIRICLGLFLFWAIAVPLLLDNIEKNYLTPLIPLMYLIISLPLLLELFIAIILIVLKNKTKIDYLFVLIQMFLMLVFYLFYLFNKSSVNWVVERHLLFSNFVMLSINLLLVFSFRKITDYMEG